MLCNIRYTVIVFSFGAVILGEAATTEAHAIDGTVPWVDAPPRLEQLSTGTLEAMTVSAFSQREPNDGAQASERTTAYLARDDRNLYVAFRCEDRTPDRIRARLARRDAVLQDDQVVVLLDTFHDRRRAYLFAVNPLGIQADAIVAEGKDDDYSFDAVWRSEGRLTADGFVALLTIPFKSLRLPPNGDGIWGIALSRVMPRNSEQSFWPYVTRRIEGLTQQFASVAGFDAASGGHNTQLIPYAAADAGRFLRVDDSSFERIRQGRAGLDAKFIVHDATAIDVAIKPDFSQVESDQPQVSINQRFEVFYPEKRPFFLENSNLFRYPAVPPTRTLPETLFFSRRIQDPQAGLRVTGKQGGWAYGGLIAVDRLPTAPDEQATASVVRVQREFGSQSSVGLFMTSRDATSDVNQVGAVDVRWKLRPTLVLAAQAMSSRSKQTDEAATHGNAAQAALLYTTRSVFATLFYADRAPAFRAALGFVPRTDIRQVEHYGEYRWRPRSGPVIAYGPNSFVRFNWDHRGQLQEWIVRFPFQIDLKGRTSVFVRRVESYELFAGVDLREHLQTVTVSTEWLKWLAVNESIEWGHTPNYFPAGGLAPFVARSISGTLGLTFRPTPKLRYEQTLLYNGLRTLPMLSMQPRAIFDNTIVRSTVNYQFTRPLAVRGIVDYNAVLANSRLAQLSTDKRAGLDLLLTYQLGPSTAFYAGYRSAFQNVELSSDHEQAILSGRTSTEVGRQMVLKWSYLFRL